MGLALMLALFPGPTQLSIAFVPVRGEPGNEAALMLGPIIYARVTRRWGPLLSHLEEKCHHVGSLSVFMQLSMKTLFIKMVAYFSLCDTENDVSTRVA